ncbi:MAG TPA: hypothetical protein VGM37_04660 [Armatimonadota bacterium]|jgi:hypothetical protein
MVRFLVALMLAMAATAMAAPVSPFDLDVMYIERTPRLNFDPSSPTGGWPAPGQDVQWVAHLHNWGTQDVASVDYQWSFDGAVVGSGSISAWKAGADATVAWPWKWEQARHSLTFQLDPAGAITGQASRPNDALTVDTDALAFGAWVEAGLAAYFHDNQKVYNDGANSFEDWLQRNMRLWTKINRDAVYPTAPNGIVDRVRLDQVIHVPNGALPLAGGLATNDPDFRDKTVDLMWGFPYHAEDVGAGHFYDPVPGSPFQYEWGLIHELDHARYLIDSYGFDVHTVACQNLTLPDGGKMLGAPVMPYPGADIVRYDKYKGMMDSTHYFSEYEAYEWNRIAGQRARYGNYNAPGDIGVFLNEDLPQNNHFRFVDQNLDPLAGATVEVRQARSYDEWYGKSYVNEPDLTYTADADGRVDMPRSPFGSYINHTYGIANSVMLLVIRSADGATRTAFVEASDFNLEFYRRHTQDAYYEVQVNTSPSNQTLGTVNPGPRGKVTGRVLDAGGSPVAGAYVGVHPDGDQYAVTDADGRYALSLPVNAPLAIAAHRSPSAAAVQPLSNRATVTALDAPVTAPDLVLPAPVANVITSAAITSAGPTSHNLGVLTDPNNPVHNAADQSFSTRWGTNWTPDGFVTRESPIIYGVVLKSAPAVNHIILHWSQQYARAYRVDVSPDGTRYATVYATDQATGGYHIPLGGDFRGVDVIAFPARPVRNIRIIIMNQAPVVGYSSLWEIQAGLAPAPYSLADIGSALQIAAGIRAAAPDDAYLDIQPGDGIDLQDAVALAKQAWGL